MGFNSGFKGLNLDPGTGPPLWRSSSILSFPRVMSTMGTGSFPGVKSGRGVTLTPHPLLVLWSRKGRAIPLLPLWAVRPVQSLRVCTRVHFTLPLCVHLSSFLPKLSAAHQPTSLSYTGACPYKCTFHLPTCVPIIPYLYLSSTHLLTVTY